MSRLDAIFQWKMTPTEAEAYKLCLLWENEAREIFPQRFPKKEFKKLPVRGDPRKSYLYQHCWKLLRETRGILPQNQMSLFIRSQLFAMKLFDGRVEPNCLCGEKAWIRWKVWKWNYDKKLAERDNLPPPPDISRIPKIAKELIKTHKFLAEKCDGEITKDKIDGFVRDGFFKMWVLSGKVSHYFVVMSPHTEEHAEQIGRDCFFEPKLVRSTICDDTRRFFEREFEDGRT